MYSPRNTMNHTDVIRASIVPLIAEIDAARALRPRDLSRANAAVDRLVAAAASPAPSIVEQLSAVAALRHPTSSDGARCAALALLGTHPCALAHLDLLCDAACGRHAPFATFLLYCSNWARIVLDRALRAAWAVDALPRATAAAVAAAVGAMPMPDDADSAKRATWQAATLGWLRANVLGPTRDQLLGSLLGQALGDATGFLVEGQSAGVAQHYSATCVRTLDVDRFGVTIGAGRDGQPRYRSLCDAAGQPTPGIAFAFGQYTDDTQLARELLLSMAATDGALDPADFAQRAKRLFVQSNLIERHAPDPHGGVGIVGYGEGTQRALQAIADGGTDAWRTAASDASTGNGGCMRAGPFGLLFYHSRPGVLAAAAGLQAHPTHASLTGKACAAAVAAATAYAARSSLAGGPFDAGSFLTDVAAVADEIHAGVAIAIRGLLASLPAPSEAALLAAVVEAGRALGDFLWADGAIISAAAVQATLWSLASFVRHPDDPVAVIAAAIDGGGDTDTTAAMAGAMAGARCGTGWLPLRLVDKLTDQGSHGADQLAALVDRLMPIMEGRRARIAQDALGTG
jgi:ADP-ribosylglycohydrolase